MGRDLSFAHNSRLAVVPADGGTPRSITDGFDESPVVRGVERRTGCISQGSQKTASHLFRVDPATGAITRVSAPDDLMAGGVLLDRDGRARRVHGRLADVAARRCSSPTLAASHRAR